MRSLVLRFVVASLVLLAGSRAALALWLWPRVEAAGGLAPLLLGGLRIDLAMIAMLAVVPAALAPWFGHRPLAVRLTAWWLRLAWLLLAFLEAITPTFIAEYDARPNRLLVEYLGSPQEVGSMLLRGFGGTIVWVLAVMALAVWAVRRLLPLRADAPMRWRWRVPASVAAILLLGLLARGTLQHRPINPSMVAYASDAMVNMLALNSLYSVCDAVYRLGREGQASDRYGSMPEARMLAIVREAAGMTGPPDDARYPTLHRGAAAAMPGRPRNLVIIVEESLGAQFVGTLGGSGLTPEFDRLAAQGWLFERAYATGTRSARGLEAIVTGFPPTPAEAVLKLPRAERHFFTLAQLLDRRGYRSRFVYGGEAHFDNMRAFFLGNGFDEVVDIADFQAPAFVGSWGASDEDMFTQVDRLLREPGQPAAPQFVVAFSVSNHSPWEYPAGRIDPRGESATPANAVRYADWALGRFFERARAAPYWKDTLFLVIADHDARVGGASLVPVRHFHIPAAIVGAGVEPRRDPRIVSQIDMAPTLLAMLGIADATPMLGADLTRRSPDRAIMQYGDNFGYLKGDALVVLEPGKPARAFRHAGENHREGADESAVPMQPPPGLADEALAHAQWAAWAYRNERYRLP